MRKVAVRSDEVGEVDLEGVEGLVAVLVDPHAGGLVALARERDVGVIPEGVRD